MTDNCPLCHSTSTKVVWSCTASEAAQQWAIAEHEPERHDELTQVITNLWSSPVGANCECQACGFGFANPFVAGDSRFYSLAFGESGYPKDKWEFQRTLDAISELDTDTIKVLEIGAGGGYFLDKLAGLGISPDRCFGTEYNDATIARMRGKGFHIHKLEVEEIASIGEQFDVVCMFQVLEHRDNLDGVFKAIKSVLKPNGHVFIAVPNSERIRYNEETGSLLDTPPNHISRWRPENFGLVAKNYGLELEEAAVQPFDAPHFLKQDLVLSFMRRAQTPGTIANYLYPRRKQGMARAAVALAVAGNAASRLPVWIKNRKTIPHLGANIWAHLKNA